MLLTLNPSPLAAVTKSAAGMHKCTYVMIKKKPRGNAAAVRKGAYNYERGRGSEGREARRKRRRRRGAEAEAKRGESWT